MKGGLDVGNIEVKTANACGKYKIFSTTEDSESAELCDVVKNIAEQPQVELSLGPILRV